MIKFKALTDYVNNLLKDTEAVLLDSNINEHHLVFTSFNNTDDSDSEQELNNVFVMFNDNGVTRETESNLTTYLQDIEVEYSVNNDYLDELTNILNTIADEYKMKTIQIDENGNTGVNSLPNKSNVMIKIEISHSDFTFEENKTYDRSTVTMAIQCIGFGDYVFSDAYTLYINDIEIPFAQLTLTRNIEVVSDGKKTIDMKFFQNTSGLVVAINSIHDGSAISESIINDIGRSANFGSTYTIKIKLKGSDSYIIDSSFVLKTGTVIFTPGSFIAYNAQFFLATVR